MIILALDPGNQRSAFVIYDADAKKIIRKGIEENHELLGILTYPDDGLRPMLVIEQIASFGMAVGETVFETVFWSGRFAQAWESLDRQWTRIKRHTVKMHLCHSMRAKDANVRQVLIDKLGAPGTKKAPGKTYGISKDLWSALAIAVTYAETRQLATEGDVIP